MITKTEEQYDQAFKTCIDIFIKKTTDYGTSWRVLRPVSITDQIFIKAKRIRTLQEKKEQRVGDDIHSEFIAIVNYGIIGLIQLKLGDDQIEDIPADRAEKLYRVNAEEVRAVMIAKNHDYGEAWREMSQESFADLILMKLLRIRQIIANDGKTLISEGVDSNFTDIINYALFALILISEGRHNR